ncbi:unnamed protein product, partial [Phaeothamnion confervicola]
QKQRVAIAGALALSPRYLILDEPTSMLDPEGRRDFMKVIAELKRRGRLGILFITHRLEELTVADCICLMGGGTIRQTFAWKELPALEAALSEAGVALPTSVQVGLNLQGRGIGLTDPTDEEKTAGVISELAYRFKPPGISTPGAGVLFQLKDVSHIYGAQTPWQHRALRNVTFEILKGEGVGLIGTTGSGKSTLAQHLNALIPTQSGQISLNGSSLSGRERNLKALRSQVGFVFQNPENQFFEETVEAEVSFAPRNFGMAADKVAQAVVDSLTWVGLEPQEFRARSPHALSGGEKRLVAIASVLAFHPEVLILDEPTAGLDATHRMSILRLLRDWRVRTGGTLIIISHELEDLAFLVERCLVLDAGEVRAFGEFRRLLSGLPELGIPLP